MLVLVSCAPAAPPAECPPPPPAPTVPAPPPAEPKLEVPTPVLGTPLPDDYVRDVGRLAFVWGWPLVNLHNRQILFSKVTDHVLGDGILPLSPLNRLSMLTDYVNPAERAVATPNQDVVYGMGIFALAKEPVIVQVPDFGERYWVYQLGNQRTDTLGGSGGLGKVYGSKPGFYLIAGPDWKGEAPLGIAGVFRSPTNLAYVIPRAFLDDTAEDRAAIQPLISQIQAYPLSEFDGTMKTKDWSKLPSVGDPAGKPGSGETKWVKPEAFFAELPLVLDEVPPLPGEEALYAQFRALLQAAANEPKIATLLQQVAVEMDAGLMKQIHSYSFAGVPTQNGWISPLNGAEFGFDYFSRAAAAKANIFVNPRRESAYFSREYDSAGKRLNGKKTAYTLTFQKEELPPVDGFWSLTLYDEAHFFAPNALKRYSLGTKNKDLKYGTDGSLTLYVQNAQPTDDKLSNWLPAPAADFELMLRAYGPKPIILDRKWSPPELIATPK